MSEFRFETSGQRRRGAHRRHPHAARRNPHAGLHAGRHGGDGQGDAAGKRARDRRRYPAGQHLSPDAAARRGAHRAAGRPAQIHGLGAADPDRLRRLPGDVAVELAQDHAKRASRFQSHIDGHAEFPLAGARDGNPAPARLRHPDGAGRMSGLSGDAKPRSRNRWRCRCAGRSARRRRSASSRAVPVSASCRAASSPICASVRPRRCSEIGFDGYAVGGLAVGEAQSAMFETLDATVPHLPADRPRYLMGVGKPDDIVGAVLRGIDMFDCVLPTRSGRNGQAFTLRRRAQSAQCAPCRGSGAARCGLRLSRLPPVQPRLSASCRQGGRDHRRHAADLAQSDLLSGPDGRACARPSRKAGSPPLAAEIARVYARPGRGRIAAELTFWATAPMVRAPCGPVAQR